MKRIKMLLIGSSTLIFTLMAFVSAASACNSSLYQPEVPKSLQKY